MGSGIENFFNKKEETKKEEEERRHGIARTNVRDPSDTGIGIISPCQTNTNYQHTNLFE